MKLFKKAELPEIEAVQFGSEEAKEFIQLCTKDSKGNIRMVPRDLLGRPEGAFSAVKTSAGWQEIRPGDWIVKKADEMLIVSNGVFKLFFSEA